MKLGVISYDCAHLKTEQLVCRYAENKHIEKVKIFALPYVKRPERAAIIQHRPNHTFGVPTKSLAELEKVSFKRWNGKESIGSLVDFFVIAGAGILNIGFADGKPIVNAHPGIIPTTRGLDSFKWAIFNGDTLGITLHLIDNEIDKGEVIRIQHTPVFSSDSIETLARRHYELEINMLSNVLDIMDERISPQDVEKPANRRMSAETEVAMVGMFDEWKENIIKNRRNSGFKP